MPVPVCRMESSALAVSKERDCSEILSGDVNNSLSVSRLDGKNVSVVAFNLELHLEPLWDALTKYKMDSVDQDLVFQYFKFGPFSGIQEFKSYLMGLGPRYRYPFAVEYSAGGVPHGRPSHSPAAGPVIVGMISYMEVVPEHRKCEFGLVLLDPRYRRMNIMDEAIYLLLRHAFDVAKYRRVKWQSHLKNEGSKKMAIRNQFTFEGITRNDCIVKGVNRDTANFSIIDSEWEEAKKYFDAKFG